MEKRTKATEEPNSPLQTALVYGQVIFLCVFVAYFVVSNIPYLKALGQGGREVPSLLVGGERKNDETRTRGLTAAGSRETGSISSCLDSLCIAGQGKGGAQPASGRKVESAVGNPFAIIQSLGRHVIFYTFVALAVIWLILLLQSRKIREHSRELQTRVARLSEELHATRAAFEHELQTYKKLLSVAKEAERSYREIFETTGTATVVVGEDDIITMVNSEFERFTGYARETLENRLPWSHIIHPEDREPLAEYKQRRCTRESDAPAHVECRVLTAGGETRVSFVRIARFPGCERFVFSFLDVTEQKQVEREALFLAQALRSVSECVSITDLDNNILFANDAFLRTYGYTREEILGKNCNILRTEASAKVTTYDATLRGGWHGELMNRRKDGTEFPIELFTGVVRSENGRPLAMIGVAVDITRRKESEERLRLSEERYRSLFENTVSGVYRVSTDGTMIDCNEAFVRILGHDSRETVLRMNARDFYLDPSQRDVFLDKVRRRGSLYAHECRLKRADGRSVCILESVRLIGGELFGTIVDISDRKEAEEKLERYTEELQQLNASKDKFFSIISHDLRAPFSTLYGFTELLNTELDRLDPETLRTITASMFTLGMRINALLENLLDWSRLQTGRMLYQPVRLDVRKLVEESIDILQESAQRKKLTIVQNVNGVPAACGDLRMVRSILQNLLSNAVKFTREGGTITIESSVRNHEMAIAVTDTGVGMSPKQLRNLFRLDIAHSTPGTANEPGSGLGLILCKELVERNNGRIWVESEEGQGSTFAFSLPRWDGGENPPAKTPEAKTAGNVA
ncbi:MAG: PAS domain-containing sensor histidine kinase [Bacteroidota bacterium]|nr:PAS domain-containing sensor histidine kinase [Bacteroidota bacterium]